MKDKYIKVIVSGLPKTGKTTVAEKIGDALSDLGFDVTMETDGDDRKIPEDIVQSVINSGIRILIQEKDAFAKQQFERKAKFPQNKPVAQMLASNPFTGQDQNISCIQCSTEFVFTVGEQEFYRSHNLDKAPRRCKACLALKKNKQVNHAGTF